MAENIQKIIESLSPNERIIIPYLNEKIDTPENLSQIYLVQGRLPSVSEDLVEQSKGAIPEPITRILNQSIELNEEAVTRAGLKVQLTKQRIRWIDGKTYVWMGRKVLTGRGETGSGLEFDVVQNKIERPNNVS